MRAPGAWLRHHYAEPMRIAVSSDYAYRVEGDRVYAERAFAVFLGEVARSFERMVVVGRLDPRPGATRYPLPESVELVPLPWYESLASPLAVLGAMLRSLHRQWRALDGVDAVWLLGPHPFAVPFAAIAALRRRRVMLGVRQDLRAYVARRHPGRPLARAAALALDAFFRLLARRCPVVAVGPAIAARYGHAPRLLEAVVSLVPAAEVESGRAAPARSYEGPLTILSAGRLSPEKNPLMPADVLAELRRRDGRDWRLEVCGEGPLESELRARLRELGVAGAAELRGYVPLDAGMRERYLGAHALLIASWTEGFPQVLVEAFAAGVPVVASDVGGIREGAPGAVLSFPPGDVGAAADALLRMAADPGLRASLVEAGLRFAREHSLEREARRVAEFLAEAR